MPLQYVVGRETLTALLCTTGDATVIEAAIIQDSLAQLHQGRLIAGEVKILKLEKHTCIQPCQFLHLIPKSLATLIDFLAFCESP